MLFSKLLEDEKLFEEYLKELEETIDIHKEALVSIRLDIYEIQDRIAELEIKLNDTEDKEEKKKIVQEIIELEDEEEALWETYEEIKLQIDDLIEELENLYDLKESIKEMKEK